MGIDRREHRGPVLVDLGQFLADQIQAPKRGIPLLVAAVAVVKERPSQLWKSELLGDGLGSSK